MNVWFINSIGNLKVIWPPQSDLSAKLALFEVDNYKITLSTV